MTTRALRITYLVRLPTNRLGDNRCHHLCTGLSTETEDRRFRAPKTRLIIEASLQRQSGTHGNNTLFTVEAVNPLLR